MPRIELIDPVYYAPNDPYHWEIDNLPLKTIIQRQTLINLALDNVLEQMRDAIGSSGSVANRLNQSIDDLGNLKAEAIDTAVGLDGSIGHSIDAHQDGTAYVRMSIDQSDKLDQVAENATDITIQVSTDGSAFLTFDDGILKLMPSTSVTPRVEAPNELYFDLAFPASAAHQHFYGQTPVHVDALEPDYINYKVTSMSTPYVDGSLRIYINGVRIFEDDDVYVPGNLVDDPWTLLSFTSDSTSGTFELSAAIADDDIIKIDFDISLV